MEEKDQKIADLETKLAESEEQCRDCKHLNKKIELNIKNKLIAENCELQKQLADKEQENECLKEEICKYEITLMDKNSQLKKQHRDKISFAVEQLEKVYEYTADVWWVDGVSEAVCNFIDQQINQLKEKKNERNND